MKLHKIHFKPSAEISLDLDDLNLILECSTAHYDCTCRQASEQGGFLYGWRNAFQEFGCDTVRASFSELDLVSKILEQVMYHGSVEQGTRLRRKIGKICNAMNCDTPKPLEYD